jgi:hypothetical protein
MGLEAPYLEKDEPIKWVINITMKAATKEGKALTRELSQDTGGLE